MIYDLQKASLWKRGAAALLDGILTCILAVGFAMLLSLLLNYDGYSADVEAAYDKYEAQYGITFEIGQEAYEAMTDTERQNYDAAYAALIADQEAMYAYNMMLNLSMVITTVGILLAVVCIEFVIPLLLGNGQTLGKKVFSLCLVRTNGVRINNMQLFARSVLGKFTFEIMIPVYILLMIFWNTIGIIGPAILLILIVSECVIMAVSRTNSLIHDLIGGTAVADMPSQRIFGSEEELLEYKKKVHAEQAARQTY